MAVRSLSGTLCMFCVCFAVMNVPLTVFTIIFNMSPFWCALIAHFWLGETLSKCNLISMIGSFGGVVVMSLADPVQSETQPNEMFSGLSERARYNIGLVACLLGSIAFALWIVFTRQVQNVHYSVIAFYTGMCDTCVSGAGLLIWLIWYEPFNFNTNWVFMEVSMAAVCSIAAQALFIQAS